MKRLVALLIFLPIGIAVVALAVANRQAVTLSIPPGVGETALLSYELPLFVLLFASLFVGMLLGSFATWITQSRHRKAARKKQSGPANPTMASQEARQGAEPAAGSDSGEQKALRALGLAPPSVAR